MDNIKKLTLRELYDMITPQLEKFGDKPVTSVALTAITAK